MRDSLAAQPLRTTRSSYAWWALFVLSTVQLVSLADRAILAVLQEPLKHELGLTDGQLGILHGLAFALCYAAMGIPIARWSESRSRSRVLSGLVAIWSAATMVSGLLNSFAQLLVARMVVGGAEAGGGPLSHSLISDYFEKHKRARAMALYSASIPLGLLFGSVVGGWVTHEYGWRWAFAVVGFPGLFVALLVRLTLREAPRTGGHAPGQDAELPTFGATMRVLLGNKTFRQILLASAVSGVGIYSVNSFVAPFLIRNHGTDIATVGLVVGLAQGLAGLAGTLFGGFVTDRYAERQARTYLYVPLVGMGGAGLLYVLAFNQPSTDLAILLLVAAYFFGGFKAGPIFASVQNLAHPRMRAVAAAILMLAISVVGSGIGPALVGFISDWLTNAAFGSDQYRAICLAGTAPDAGFAGRCASASAAGIQGALTFAGLTYIWSTIHFYLGSRTVEADMRAVGNA